MPPSGERTRQRLTLEDVNNIITDLEENAMVNNEMPMYIGTKLVQAEPCIRAVLANGSITYYDGDVPALEEGELRLAGYKVVYQDGYESWSPKEVFEQAYRQVDGLSFGMAIEAMKQGRRVTRRGWNGRGMYIFLADRVELLTMADLSELAGEAECLPCIVMRNAQRKLVPGWLASQTDMLADDWMLLPDCGMMSWPQAEEAIKEGKAVCRTADGWEGVHFVGLIEEPEELAGKVCMVTKEGTIHPDWEPTPDDLTGNDWYEVYLPGKEN